MVFQCINIRQFPWEVLKTAAFGLGFQYLPRDHGNVNAWKTMFDPYIVKTQLHSCKTDILTKKNCNRGTTLELLAAEKKLLGAPEIVF